MATITSLGATDSGSASRTTINSNFTNLNTDKAEKTLTVNGKAISTSPTLGLASSDFANQGTTTTVLHGSAAGNPSFGAVVEADITLADNTTNDVSTSKHGFVPKAPNDGTKFLDGTGGFSVPLFAPTGSIVMYGGSSAPSGYVLCDGSSLLRSGTYAALFAIVGTAYGSADGTHFNVPDLRGRAPVGVGTGTGGGASGTGLPAGGSALTAVSLGTWKGEETHVLTVGELAAHTHLVGTAANVQAGGAGGNPAGNATGSSSSTGSDTAHNNIQPVTGVNFIIKT